MLQSRLPERLGPVGLTVVGTGTIETVVRLLPESMLVAFDSRLGAVLASSAINLGVRDSLVLSATQLVFLVAVFYFFMPTVYPPPIKQRVRSERSFRAILAVVAGAFALPVVFLGSAVWASIVATAIAIGDYLLLTTVLSCALIAAYLSVTQAEPLGDPAGEAYDMIDVFSSDARADSKAEFELTNRWPRWARVIGRLLAAGGTAAGYVTPLVLLGWLGGALNAVFPVLELLVLLGILWDVGDARESRFTRWLSSTALEIEDTLYDHLTSATQGATGAAGTTACVVGILVPISGLLVYLDSGLFDPGVAIVGWGVTVDALAGWAAGTGRLVGVGRPFLRAVAETGEEFALPVSAGIATWYWYHTIQYLPSAVARLESTGSVATGDEESPARSVWVAVAAGGLALLWKLELEASIGSFRDLARGLPVELLFAVGWPALLLISLLLMRRPTHEDDAGWPVDGLRLFGGLFWTGLIGYVAVMSIDRVVWFALLGSVMFAWLFYLQPLGAWADSNRRHPRVVVALYGQLPALVAIVTVSLGVFPPGFLLMVVMSPLMILHQYLVAYFAATERE